MFPEDKLDHLKRLLDQAQHIVLTTHARPDGDAVGSSLGLFHFLVEQGKKVTSITPNEVATYLQFLPGTDQLLDATTAPEKAAEAIADADLIFCLDYSALNRIDDLGEVVTAAKAPKVLIDHHLGPEDWFDLEFHDTVASSTCELVYLLIEDMAQTDAISEASAESLYTGLVTDTGSFRHSNTSARVHRIASSLIEKGAKVEKVAQNVFDSFTETRMRFLGHCISKKLKILPQYRTAYITVSQQDLKDFNVQTGDSEGLVNYTLALEGNIFGVMITDRGDKVKLSFRSKGKFPARSFAQKFNGGGHLNASGGASDLSLEETEKRFLNLLEDFAREEGFDKY